MNGSLATLEAATVIRVPPPGLEPGYVVAVVRTANGLSAVRLLADPGAVPRPGTAVEETTSPVPGVATYRPVGTGDAAASGGR